MKELNKDIKITRLKELRNDLFIVKSAYSKSGPDFYGDLVGSAPSDFGIIYKLDRFVSF